MVDDLILAVDVGGTRIRMGLVDDKDMFTMVHVIPEFGRLPVRLNFAERSCQSHFC
jgi:hypothetical protein